MTEHPNFFRNLKPTTRDLIVGGLGIYVAGLAVPVTRVVGLTLIVIGVALWAARRKRWKWHWRAVAVAIAFVTVSALFVATRWMETPAGPKLSLELATAIPVTRVNQPMTNGPPIHAVSYGLTFAVRAINNGDASTQVQALWVEGDESVTPNEYLLLQHGDGKTLDELGADYEKKRPYRSISWSMSPVGTDTTISPNEEKYFLFSAINPLDSKVRLIPDEFSLYVGESSGRRPERYTTAPTLLDFVTVTMIQLDEYRQPRLRKEVVDGTLRVFLQTNHGRLPIDPGSMRVPTLVAKHELEQNQPRDVFYGKDAYGGTDGIPRPPTGK